MTIAGSSVLIDQIAPTRARTRDVLSVVGFGLLTALLAQVRIPVPPSPIPITGQTFAVLLAGAVLGMRRGFASQGMYLALGSLGIPVFAGGIGGAPHLLGPTGGYLWSFPVAAGLLGWLVERGASLATWKLALSLVASDLLILAAGTAWLAILSQSSVIEMLRWGAYPFLVSNTIKVAAVGVILPRLVRRHRDAQSG